MQQSTIRTHGISRALAIGISTTVATVLVIRAQTGCSDAETSQTGEARGAEHPPTSPEPSKRTAEPPVTKPEAETKASSPEVPIAGGDAPALPSTPAAGDKEPPHHATPLGGSKSGAVVFPGKGKNASQDTNPPPEVFLPGSKSGLMRPAPLSADEASAQNDPEDAS